jgi:FkbM family methyltransferase
MKMGIFTMLPRVDVVRTDQFDYLLAYSHDHISNTIRRDGEWGQVESTLCRYFTVETKGAIVIDAGSNLGGFALPVAKHLQDLGGLVHCFEPQRIVFQQLCGNIFLNRLDNVFTHNVALGDGFGQIEIPELDFKHSMNIGGLSVDPVFRRQIEVDAENGINIKNTIDTQFGNFKVAKIPLDSLELFDNVRFIKADIEGWELEFFQGAEQTIRRNNFPPIIFELWNFPWYREKGEKTAAFLAELGYVFQGLDREILAQHPHHERQLRIDRETGKIELDIRSVA